MRGRQPAPRGGAGRASLARSGKPIGNRRSDRRLPDEKQRQKAVEMKRNLIPALVAQAFQKTARNRPDHHRSRPRPGAAETAVDARNAECRNGTADEAAGKTGEKKSVVAEARNVRQPALDLVRRLACREPSQKGGAKDPKRRQLARARPHPAPDGKDDAEVDRGQRGDAEDREIPERVVAVVAQQAGEYGKHGDEQGAPRGRSVQHKGDRGESKRR